MAAEGRSRNPWTLPASQRSRAAIFGAALLWSTGGAAIKLSSLSAPQIAGGRALIAAIAMVTLVPASRGKWNLRIFYTALAYALCCTLFVFANTLTTAGNAIFIQNTASVWVLLLSPWLLGEHPSVAEKISVPISIVGCSLFFLGDMTEGRLAGNLCAIAASVAFALLIIGYRKLSPAEGFTATVAGNVLIVLCAAPFALAGRAPEPVDLAILLYLGLPQQLVPALLFIRGIRGVSALEGALLVLFEPVLSPLWAFLLVGEAIGPFAFAGAALILGSTVWRAIFRQPSSIRHENEHIP